MRYAHHLKEKFGRLKQLIKAFWRRAKKSQRLSLVDRADVKILLNKEWEMQVYAFTNFYNMIFLY